MDELSFYWTQGTLGIFILIRTYFENFIKLQKSFELFFDALFNFARISLRMPPSSIPMIFSGQTTDKQTKVKQKECHKVML